MKFMELVKYFERLEATTKRLEMFEILADLFKRCEVSEIDKIIYMSQGQLLPSFHGIDLGMSEKLLMRAISIASGQEIVEIGKRYKELGDLGKTAEAVLHGDGKGLSVDKVYSAIFDMAGMGGEGSVEKKITSIGDLLSDVTPVEAKYIARFVAGRLRLGVGDATVLEALSLAKFGREYKDQLERAYNLCSDLGLVGRILFEEGDEGIKKIKAKVGYPIRMELCERLSSAEEIIEKIGRCSIEAKYDGFRCQVHKSKDRIEIFSRNLERTTPMFPEIVDAAANYFSVGDGIFEGEAIVYNEASGELLPFQVTIQRKRKHGIDEAARDFPLKFFAFDLLFADGVDYTDRPYIERRNRLNERIKKGNIMELSNAIITEDPREVLRFFEDAVGDGLEGIVAKRLDSPYSAGARNFNWIKLKRSYKGELADTIDVCILGYYMGKGSRARFGIGGLLAGVYDHVADNFKTITRIGSGFTELELSSLKEMLDEIRVQDKPHDVDSLIAPDVWVLPKYVVTVAADEITRSPMHTCGMEEGMGYALRFPRMQGFIREDKGPQDATRVSEIEEIYKRQRHVKLQ
ncbi:MAG TPA: ATP-dependent DNA ligase [Nitrospiria bacterium]|nr:ATP-dependent DNA ligase [Nitrospiria bacterium]